MSPRTSTKNLKAIPRKRLPELKPHLEELVQRMERPDYIEKDPVLFVHVFDDKEDQLLAGFFAAIMAWGRRDIVIRKVHDLLERMNYQPTAFIRGFTDDKASLFDTFKHRTFKPIDIYWLIRILQTILNKFGSFEDFWQHCYEVARKENRELIAVFHEEFFAQEPEAAQRTRKHISNPEKNSSCKRLYLYLRWTLREGSVVDQPLMDFMPVSELMIPLDVHVARYARALGLLTRTYNDWKAVCELTDRLRTMAPKDPARYDYALFGLGVESYELPDEWLINPHWLD